MGLFGIKSKYERQQEKEAWYKSICEANIMLKRFPDREEVKRFYAFTAKNNYEKYPYGPEIRDTVINYLIRTSIVPAVIALETASMMSAADWAWARDLRRKNQDIHQDLYAGEEDLRIYRSKTEDYVFRAMTVSYKTVIETLQENTKPSLKGHDYAAFISDWFVKAGGVIPEECIGMIRDTDNNKKKGR
ncbi:MAG: hypothetical protein IKO10_16495 [Lachnospiraceae bacterium]|nr:hypothetical protein [Lachnospiraceae bacterium]